MSVDTSARLGYGYIVNLEDISNDNLNLYEEHISFIDIYDEYGQAFIGDIIEDTDYYTEIDINNTFHRHNDQELSDLYFKIMGQKPTEKPGLFLMHIWS